MANVEIDERFMALVQAVNNLTNSLIETRDALEKLGKMSGLEYSQDVKDWVSKDQLDQLRREPR